MVKTIKYGYYPGCSLESTAKEYNLSIAAAAKLLDVELVELDDWNCCGASSDIIPTMNFRWPYRHAIWLCGKSQTEHGCRLCACFLRFKPD